MNVYKATKMNLSMVYEAIMFSARGYEQYYTNWREVGKLNMLQCLIYIGESGESYTKPV